ncbi:MAG: MurR/RpiR family transcriptional regulator [Tissierellaceae bacterium]|nr:MurR/RpiR family transcriptional regulator [Tissierellaceae bacterium]
MRIESTSGGLAMIKNIYEDLPGSEKKVAKYVLDKPQGILNMTVAELAAKSQSSSSAVMRLCKSLGFKSYQELKIRIIRDIDSSENEDYIDIKKGDTIESVAKTIKNNSIKSFEETFDFFNYDILEKSVETIVNAKTIVMVGLGGSFIAAKDAQQKFIRINKTCYALEDMHLNATIIANLDKKDLVIGISASGETREVIKLIEKANEKGIETIGITNYGRNSLSKIVGLSLFTPADIESPLRSAATSSRLSQLFIIDVLFTYLATVQYHSTVEYLEKTKKAIDEFRL